MNDNPYAAPETLDPIPDDDTRLYPAQAKCIMFCFRIAMPLALVIILIIEFTALKQSTGFDKIPLNPYGIKAIVFSLFTLCMHEGCIFISRAVNRELR